MNEWSAEALVAILMIAAMVALYFVQDKRARVGIGLAAIIGAFIAGWSRQDKPAEDVPSITPDTMKEEREDVTNSINELNAEVEAAGIAAAPTPADPVAVDSLRARLKRHRDRVRNSRDH